MQANLDALFSAAAAAAITLQTAAGFTADRRRLGLLPRRRGRGVRAGPARRRGAARQRRRPGRRAQHRLVRVHLAAGPAEPRRPAGPGHRPAHGEHLAGGAGLRAQPALLAGRLRATRPAARLGLVYLYKQGTFYPFAPQGPQQRDNLLEIQIRDLVKDDLPVEPQTQPLDAAVGRPRPLRPDRWVSRVGAARAGRSSIRCSATLAQRSVSGSTSIRFTTVPGDQVLHRPHEVRQVDAVHRRAVADGLVQERDVLLGVRVREPLHEVELGADRPRRAGAGPPRRS